MDKAMLFKMRCGANPWRRSLAGLSLVVLVLIHPGWSLGSTAYHTKALQDDLAFQDEISKGRQFQQRRQYEEALRCFKRANEMRDRKSPEALLWMAQAFHGLEAYKNAVESAERAIEFAGNESRVRALGYNLKGMALQSQSEGKDQKKLQEAEAAFRQGLAMKTDVDVLHYNLGFTLMQLGRDPEVIAEMEEYLRLQPRPANAQTAREMIKNPRRAREKYAPEFSITTADGEYISLDELRGKVVLLDFWGTWCGPCVASVPSLRSLYKRFEKERTFVMIAISSDTEAEKWRSFIAKNQMVWPQTLDRNRKVSTAFEVRGWPTYVLIDHEGIVRFRSLGFGSDGTSKIEDAIRKALKATTKTSASN